MVDKIEGEEVVEFTTEPPGPNQTPVTFVVGEKFAVKVTAGPLQVSVLDKTVTVTVGHCAFTNTENAIAKLKRQIFFIEIILNKYRTINPIKKNPG